MFDGVVFAVESRENRFKNRGGGVDGHGLLGLDIFEGRFGEGLGAG